MKKIIENMPFLDGDQKSVLLFITPYIFTTAYVLLAPFTLLCIMQKLFSALLSTNDDHHDQNDWKSLATKVAAIAFTLYLIVQYANRSQNNVEDMFPDNTSNEPQTKTAKESGRSHSDSPQHKKPSPQQRQLNKIQTLYATNQQIFAAYQEVKQQTAAGEKAHSPVRRSNTLRPSLH